jgi:hypothetical protein
MHEASWGNAIQVHHRKRAQAKVDQCEPCSKIITLDDSANNDSVIEAFAKHDQ